MAVIDTLLDLGQEHLPENPRHDAGFQFELSIGEDESVAYSVLENLHSHGVPLAPSLIEQARQEYGWSPTFAEMIERITSEG